MFYRNKPEGFNHKALKEHKVIYLPKENLKTIVIFVVFVFSVVHLSERGFDESNGM